MRDLLPFVVVGVTNGSIYAIAGLGLVLTYRTSGIFNFAHGAQAALGAYLLYTFRDQLGWPWPAAAATALVLAGIVGGLLLERLAFLLEGASTSTRVVATVGLLVGLQGVITAVYGGATIPFKDFLPAHVVRLAGVNVRVSQLIVTGLAVVAAVGLFLFFRRAGLGVAMQGVVDNPALLSLQGTSPAAVRRWAWTIGSCFASVSGMLLAPSIGLDAVILTLLVVQAFGAAAVGAFNSLAGTYLGGLAVGTGAALATKYLSRSPQWSGVPAVLPFLVLFVVLLVMPRHRLVERGMRTVRRLPPPIALGRGVTTVALAAGAVLLAALPAVVSGRLPVYTNALVYAILFASLSLLVRTSGQVSLCHMAFAAVGAAGFGHAAGAGVPWVLAVLVGGLAAVPVGAVVAIPAIRLSGVYLAIATFGFGILVERLFLSTSIMLGPRQLLRAPRPSLGGLHTGTDTGYYYVVLAVALACSLALVGVRRCRLGRLLRALGDSPAALTAFGTGTNTTRVFLFAISAFFAGVAGAVMGPVTGSATGPSFSFGISLTLLAVLAVAGRQPVVSGYLAAALYAVVPSYVKNPALAEWVPVAFGVAALLAATSPLRLVLPRLARSKRARERAGRPVVNARLDLAGSGVAS